MQHSFFYLEDFIGIVIDSVFFQQDIETVEVPSVEQRNRLVVARNRGRDLCEPQGGGHYQERSGEKEWRAALDIVSVRIYSGSLQN